MTIGFAATIYVDGRAGFLMAADSRASTKDDDSSDIAIKTYSLDWRAGAIGSGNAISIATAAEMTRGIVADHNSENPDEPVNFYNIVRVSRTSSTIAREIEAGATGAKSCSSASS